MQLFLGVAAGTDSFLIRNSGEISGEISPGPSRVAPVHSREARSRAIDLLGLQTFEPTLGLDLGCIKENGTTIIRGGRGIIAKPLQRQTTVEISQREAPVEFDG